MSAHRISVTFETHTVRHFTHVSMVVGGVVHASVSLSQGGCDATPSKLKIVGQKSQRSTVDLHGLHEGMMEEYWETSLGLL